MGLSTHMMKALCARLKPGARVASMGYPDILAPQKELESVLGARIYQLKRRDDSDWIGTWHGVKNQIPDAHSFFNLLGAQLDVFDIEAHRGGEIQCDLNDDWRAWGDHGVRGNKDYDFVLDVGTLEHCFNIGQAARNMAFLLKAGGIIFHENPYNQGNHGFYNINPTWYHDFYSQSGFELLDMVMIARNGDGDGTQVGGVLKTKRFRFMESEATMFAIAQRKEILPIVFPVQSKYARMISAPAAGDRAKAAAA